MRKINLILILCSALSACGGGGGSANNGTDPNLTSVDPYPYPQAQQYPTPPVWNLPTDDQINTTPSTYIAYGSNRSNDVMKLTALVNIDNTHICTATPIHSDGTGTWLVTTAHCILNKKSNANTVLSSELVNPATISIETIINGKWNSTQAQAVYTPKDYCYGATFSELGGCPNFTANQDAGPNAEGNDIALIYTSGIVGDPTAYPIIEPQNQYPQPYTMAPILSVGNGQTDATEYAGTTFYVTNYFYRQTDEKGYHYIYNSYFENNSTNSGYLNLACSGDSGGGDFFWNGSKWVLLAAHSFGQKDSCGSRYNYLPTASTDVGSYYNWIMNIINSQTPINTCNDENNNCSSTSL